MSTPLEIAAGVGVEVIIFSIALAVLYRFFGKFLPLPARVVVPPFRCGVLVRSDKAARILKPGAYWISPSRTLLLCDTRPIPFELEWQEVLTAQGRALRVGVSGEYRIVDPEAFVSASSNAASSFFLELRQTLRGAVKEISTGDPSPGALHDLTARIKELATPKATHLGVEIALLEICEATSLGKREDD